MHFDEHLLWIMDHKKESIPYEEDVPDRSISADEWVERNLKKDHETIRKNIDFVRSLGLKCDSVGWCGLDLNRPDIDELLARIQAFALKEKLYLRGYYSRSHGDFESEWYLLASDHLSYVDWDYAEAVDRDGNPLTLEEVKACQIPKTVQVLWSAPLPHVNERFRDCCLRHGFSGVDFYWIRDIGRYRAAQFFGLIVDRMVPEFACDHGLTYSDSKNCEWKNFDHSEGSPLYRKYRALGGRLTTLSQMFYDLDVSLPVRLPKNLMPETDFAYIHFYRSDYNCRGVLIRKHAAETLIAEKAVRKDYLKPVALYEAEPEGYTILKSEPVRYPAPEVVRRLEAGYEALKQNPKPERNASGKDALRLFRQMKRVRPEDFRKGLAGKIRETFTGTPYEPLAPYYAVSDGGDLSDEYAFLSHAESVRETREYERKIMNEELLGDRCVGIVIATCADGDVVVFCGDGSVRRISHETMDAGESWDTVAQFFFEAMSDA